MKLLHGKRHINKKYYIFTIISRGFMTTVQSILQSLPSNHFKDLRLTLKNFPHHFRGLYSIVLQQSCFKERFCLPKLIATRDTLSLYLCLLLLLVLNHYRVYLCNFSLCIQHYLLGVSKPELKYTIEWQRYFNQNNIKKIQRVRVFPEKNFFH